MILKVVLNVILSDIDTEDIELNVIQDSQKMKFCEKVKSLGYLWGME